MKICGTCKVEKDESEYYKEKSRKYGLCPRCKACERIKSKKKCDKAKVNKPEKPKRLRQTKPRPSNFHTITPEKQKESDKKWRLRNKAKLKKAHQDWKRRNFEAVKKQKKIFQEKGRIELRDEYLKTLLYNKGFSYAEIKEYPALIQLQRLLIINKRKIKQISNDNKD